MKTISLIVLAFVLSLNFAFANKDEQHPLARRSIQVSAVIEKKVRDSKLIQVDGENRFIRVSRTPLLTTDDFTEATASTANGLPMLSFKVKEDAAKRFNDFTAQHPDAKVALIVDGKVLITPKLRGGIAQNAFDVTFGDRSKADQVSQLFPSEK